MAELNVKLLKYTPDPEGTITLGARLCYSEDSIDDLCEKLSEEEHDKYIERLIQIGHHSVVEHANFTFGIEGISRTVLAQITRHRISSFSVRSQRYVNESKFDFIIPERIKNLGQEYIEEFEEDMFRAAVAYKKWHKRLVSAGVNEKDANDDARYVLPNATETKLIMTMNARELLHFFKLRCCNRANSETKRLAWKMLELVKEVAPPCLSMLVQVV